jgi:flagellar hook-associated protein 1 FlgK
LSGLFTILINSRQALGAYGSAINTLQQNLVNASTPGYARQSPILVDLAFSPSEGLPGGVRFAGVRDTRDRSLDEAIRYQASHLERWRVASDSLGQITGYLSAGEDAGLDKILGSFFEIAQSWTPDSGREKSALFLNQARLLATTVNDIASGLAGLRDGTIGQIRMNIERLNSLAQSVAAPRASDAVSEAGLDTLLREMSELADITLSREADGSLTVLLGGQVPLVSGGKAHTLSVALKGGRVAILDAGSDVTDKISGGQLGAKLGLVNGTYVKLIGDNSIPGAFNVFAKQLADRVNSAVGVGGLFGYHPSPPGAAASLQVIPALTPDTFQSDSAHMHSVGALGLPGSGNAELGGAGFVEYFQSLVFSASMESAAAQTSAERHSALLDQAESLRSKVSGVDLSLEAVELLQMQRGFEAITKVMSSVNELIDSVLNLVR